LSPSAKRREGQDGALGHSPAQCIKKRYKKAGTIQKGAIFPSPAQFAVFVVVMHVLAAALWIKAAAFD
jgi:hypothetical protein